MKTNEPIKIQRDETIIYGSQLREEYYFFTWKGYCCEETFSYDEIIFIIWIANVDKVQRKGVYNEKYKKTKIKFFSLLPSYRNSVTTSKISCIFLPYP